MTFDEEIHPRIQFSNNPLKVVVAQIKFPAAYGLVEPPALAAFQAALGHRYPNPLPRVPHITVTLGPAGADTNTDAGPVRFASEDGTWLVNIATEWVSLETTAYQSWPDFRGRFEELIGSIPGGLRPMRATRIGIRYVDQIQAPGVAQAADWRQYIQPNLLANEIDLMFDDRLVRGLQQLSIVIDDDGVNVRHGYVRNEPDADFPSTYVIDTDLFTDTEQPFDAVPILDRLNRYHRWAWNLFRRSITPAAVELLGGTEV